MPAVANVGEISYNGIALGVMTTTEGIRVVPVESHDRRTVTHSTFTFTFKTTIAGATTAAQTLAVREKLLERGKAFRYSGRGVNLAVNVGRVKDVAYGPVTREVSFRPLGGAIAAEMVWTLETSIPTCGDAVYEFALMSLVYAVTYDVSRDGYTDRHHTGFLKIPQSLVANGTRLNDSPDYYLERIIPPVLAGFRRVYGPRTVSEDRTQLHFSVTDEELGRNVPPPGVIEVKSSHRVSSNVKGLTQWVGVLTAAYTLEKRVKDVYLPARHFFGVLLKDRLTATANALKKGDGKAIVPIGMELGEPNIHGRENVANFSFTYTFVRELKDGILGASGLWRGDPASNWRLWNASIANTALHPRGYAKLVFDVGDDQGVVSLCKPGNPTIPTTRGPDPGSLPNGPRAIGSPGQQEEGFLAELIRNVVPPPTRKRSYIGFINDIWIETDAGVVNAVSLPAKPLTHKDDVFGDVDDAAGVAANAYKDFAESMPPQFVDWGTGGGRIENETTGGVQRRASTQVPAFRWHARGSSRWTECAPSQRIASIAAKASGKGWCLTAAAFRCLGGGGC